MKLTIDPKDFADAMSFVARFSPKRPTNIILGGVMMRAEQGQLHLSVFDYQNAATTALAAEISTDGAALVHATTLQQWASKLPRKPLTIETEDNTLKLRCGPVRASLPLMPIADYPDTDLVSKPVATISGAIFDDLVQRIALAASSDDQVPVLTCVHVTVEDDSLTMAATDRYRVAHMAVKCSTSGSAEASIPALALREAAKAFAASEEVEIGLTGNDSLTFKGERGTIFSRPIVGKFPPVERLFPAEVEKHALLGAEVVSEATLRAALALQPMGAVKFTFREDSCTVEGTSEGKGMVEEFDTAFDGDELEIGLRPQFFVDGIGACRSDDVHMWFMPGGGGKPGPVMLFGGDGFRYLLQPNLLLKEG